LRPQGAGQTLGLPHRSPVAKNLFFGEIVEENLFPYPQMRDRDREMLGMMVTSIDDFLASYKDQFRHWDEAAEQPAEFIQGLRDMGLFGLIIPEEHGGLGSVERRVCARADADQQPRFASVSLTIGAHSSIGMKGILLSARRAEGAYLPKLASGEMIAAFCLTESGAGSDAASIRTTAKKNADGTLDAERREDLDHQRRHRPDSTRCSRAPMGTDGKITAFIVEAAWPGVSHGAARGQDGHPRLVDHDRRQFSDVRVPAD
jgi:acyl-CoA dehydrogenase family protein 9